MAKRSNRPRPVVKKSRTVDVDDVMRVLNAHGMSTAIAAVRTAARLTAVGAVLFLLGTRTLDAWRAGLELSLKIFVFAVCAFFISAMVTRVVGLDKAWEKAGMDGIPLGGVGTLLLWVMVIVGVGAAVLV